MWSGIVTDKFSVSPTCLNPRRYLALWFPYLATDRLRLMQAQRASARLDRRPLVTAEKIKGALRIMALDCEAARLGLAQGLALADARARVPDLMAVAAEPEADARFLARIAGLCEQFTPLVALDQMDGLLLDISGCAHLFGGETELGNAVRRRLSCLGLAIHACVAGTPDAARALARFSDCKVAVPGEDESLVRSLPIAALGLPAGTALALARAGLRTIGDLADRPSAALSARFGQDLGNRMRRTLGQEDIRITPMRAPPVCMAERNFPAPLMESEGLLDVLARLIREVADLLEANGSGGRAFEASFFRTDGIVRRMTIETSRSTRDETAILRLFREKLDALADPLDPGFGFDVVRLTVLVSQPFEALEPDFTGRDMQDAMLAELIDQLAARFGRDRVLQLAARDSHHPERTAQRVPASGSTAASALWPWPEPAEPPLRPLQLFSPPQPIEALAEVPDGPPLRFRWRRVLHEITRAEGPERISPEWWRDGSDEPTRDYYRVEDIKGRRFWVFRQGLYGEPGETPRWFMHGLFA